MNGAAASSSPAPENISGVPASKSALVVLDNELNSDLFDHLNSSGWSVEYVADNRAALDTVHQRPFDLIITAEGTPAKQDLDLLRNIRAVRPHTRMIILTAESTTRDVVDALKQRAFSYFSKPYSFDDLTRVIRMVANG